MRVSECKSAITEHGATHLCTGKSELGVFALQCLVNDILNGDSDHPLSFTWAGKATIDGISAISKDGEIWIKIITI